MKYFTLLSIFLLTSCVSSDQEGIDGNKGNRDITITLLKVNPPAASVNPNDSFSFSGIGGKDPYIFSMSDGSGSINPQSGTYTAPASTGNATIKLTDAEGNSSYATINIGSPLSISPATTNLATTSNLTLTGLGGVPPYSYTITNGQGAINLTTGVFTSSATTEVVSIEVKDVENATAYANITVVNAMTINTGASLNLEINSSQTFSASGGAPPYAYSIYAGGGSINPTTGLFTAPGGTGTIIVRITDSNNIYKEVTATILSGPTLQSTSDTVQLAGNITFSSSTGTPPFTYSISSGVGSVVSSTGIFSADASLAGTVIVQVVDANSFSTTKSITVFHKKQASIGYNNLCILEKHTDNITSTYKCLGTKSNAGLGDGESYTGDAIGEMGDSLPFSDIGSNNIKHLYSSNNYTVCALLTDHSMKCWGRNDYGQRLEGSGAVYDRGLSVNQLGSNVPTIKLGNTVEDSISIPDHYKVSLGTYHTCAITEGQDLKCWGSGYNGRLGTGTTSSKGSSSSTIGTQLPYALLGADKVKQVSLGDAFTCALLTNNTVKCWGYNGYGQLGQGDTNDLGYSSTTEPQDFVPIVFPGGVNAKEIAAGYYHACAILTDNNIACWGRSNDGQLGQGDTVSQLSPVLVDLGQRGATPDIPLSIRSKVSHTCVLFADVSDTGENFVKCWGRNNYGQLGLNDNNYRGNNPGEMGVNLPEVSASTVSQPVEIQTSYDQTCIIFANQKMKCWGHGGYGALGQENTSTIGDHPGEVGDALNFIDFGTGLSASSVAVLTNSVCVSTPENKIKCFGREMSGSLAQGRYLYGDDAVETLAAQTSIDFGSGMYAKSITVGGHHHRCTILMNESVKCFGNGGNGRLGIGNSSSIGDHSLEMGDNLAVTNLGTGLIVKKMVSSEHHNCAIFTDGRLKCWGYNGHGQLGQGNTTQLGDSVSEIGDNLPFVFLGAGKTAIDITLGRYHTCVLLNDNSVSCFGRSNYGQLGLASTTDQLSPVTLNMGGAVKSLSSGEYHTCALYINNDIKCWGYNGNGALGHGSTTNYGGNAGETPAAIPSSIDLGAGLVATKLTSGYRHNCALLNNKKIKCWGYNGYGALGLGDQNNRGDQPSELGNALPYTYLGTNYKAIDIFMGPGQSSCALLENNDLKCWGRNTNGQLGQGHNYDIGKDLLSLGDNLTPL